MMTTEEFERCLRDMKKADEACGRKGLSEEEIRSILQLHSDLKSGKRKIPDWVKEHLRWTDTEAN